MTNTRTRTRPALLLLPATVLGIAIVTACTTSAPGPCDLADCTDPADGAVPDGNVVTDAKPDTAPPAGCDTPNEPLKNPEKCLVDAFGAYVSPTGDDANDGTKAKPFRTIGKALGTTQPRIVVCEGEYAGSLEIKRDVSILSGIDCGFTKAGAKAKVVATKPEYAVSVEKAAGAVLLSELEVAAVDGTATSVNSVGIVANEVVSLKLVGVAVTARRGFDGAPGVGGATLAYTVGAPGNGNPADMSNPGPAKSCSCANASLTAGGGGGAPAIAAGNGGEAIPPNPAGQTGAGGTNGGDCVDGMGKRGAIRSDAGNAVSETSLGALDGAGWKSSPGIDGASGLAGQGGGGGASRGVNSYGGSGGCGGCGGTGGKGGLGGGASIALLTVSSVVSLERTTLTGGSGGSGGSGGTGGTGAAGAAGGGSLSGCSGGDGGKGGAGGAGGGGAGGISYGIVYKGTKPTRAAGSTVSGGQAGKGGTNGAGVADHGPAGTSGEELEAQ